jgi:ACS family glucarate transporter-like MFS transporter
MVRGMTDPRLSRRRPGRFILLLGFVSLVGYTVRSDISVAQEFLAPDLGLTLNDVGTITAIGFQLAYALFQIPAGFLGDRFGARLVLGGALVLWALGALGSALVPAGAAFAPLFAARFLLGMGQAATYPVGAMAIAQAVPPERRATANAYFISSALLGAALAPLALAPLMVRFGWRAVFLASAGLALAAALLWIRFAPADRSADAAPGQARLSSQLRASLLLLRDRNLLLLSTGYMLHAAVFFVFIFWFFRYLTEGRGFSVLASGFWGSLPALTAFLLAPLGGILADRVGRGRGPEARVRVAVGCILLAAVLVVVGANLPGPVPAIAALSLSVACINASEGPLWATATSIKPGTAGAAGGILNFMGNVGGIISIWAVPRMKDAWGWTTMLGIWAGVAVVAALLWSMVRFDRVPSQTDVRKPLSAA